MWTVAGHFWWVYAGFCLISEISVLGWGLCIIGYQSETHSNLNLAKSRSSITSLSAGQSLWYFTHSTTIPKKDWAAAKMWAKETPRDLSLRCFRMDITLHKSPGWWVGVRDIREEFKNGTSLFEWNILFIAIYRNFLCSLISFKFAKSKLMMVVEASFFNHSNRCFQVYIVYIAYGKYDFHDDRFKATERIYLILQDNSVQSGLL